MDWIKIKAEHISPELTNAQVGALIRFQLFIAKYGRYPTDKEIKKEVGIKDYLKLKETLSKFKVSLKYIQSKVEEDRKEVESRREKEKVRKRKQRAEKECPTGQDTQCHGVDKIRVDKRKENKIREELTPLEMAVGEFEKYRKSIKKPFTKEALKRFYSKLENMANTEEEKIALIHHAIDKGWQTVYEKEQQKSIGQKSKGLYIYEDEEIVNV